MCVHRSLQLLPHSAPSWIVSLAENLANSILQDGATKLHDFVPATTHPTHRLQKRQKRKDERKRSQKKNKSNKTNTISDKIIPNLKTIPKNIAHLVEKGDMVYCVPGDGACGPNSISAHLFKDEVYGSKLRLNMNRFMVKHWDKKYKYKTQCSDGHPFKRKIGGGGEISFIDPIELLKGGEQQSDF